VAVLSLPDRKPPVPDRQNDPSKAAANASPDVAPNSPPPAPPAGAIFPDVAMPTGAYGDRWRDVAQAAADFSTVELKHGAAATAAACAKQAARLDDAVAALVATPPPPEFTRFHWTLRPLFEEMSTAARVVCDGRAANNPNQVAAGWAWLESVREVLVRTLPTLAS
jgi:hypothetical protein